MKSFRRLIILFFVFFIIGAPFAVSAESAESVETAKPSLNAGLLTEPFSDEKKADILARNEFVKITAYTPLVICCFDIRDDHMLVVGAKKRDTAVIAVYDKHGKFQYGFETEELGSFGVMWNGHDIAYYSIRSACLFIINNDGKILDVGNVLSIKENRVCEKEVFLSTTRTVGTSTYRMTNGGRIAYSLSGSYKIITRTEADGTTTTVYDASADRQSRDSKVLLYLLIVSPILAIGCIKGIQKTIENIKLKKMKKSQS